MNLILNGLQMAKISDLEGDVSCVWQTALMRDAVIRPARQRYHNLDAA